MGGLIFKKISKETQNGVEKIQTIYGGNKIFLFSRLSIIVTDTALTMQFRKSFFKEVVPRTFKHSSDNTNLQVFLKSFFLFLS